MRMYPRNYGTMNRVIARAVSHAVNDHYRYNRYNYNTSNSTGEWTATKLTVMFFCLFFILAACGAM